MPPALALAICTVFVLYLLRLEQQLARNTSGVLWMPTVWMLVIASKPLGTWFGSGGGEEGSPLDQYFLIALICLGVWTLTSRNFKWSRAMRANPWVVLLIGYELASVLWSDIPFIAFKRWIRELIAVIMAFVVLTERDPVQAMQSLFRRTIYILIPFSLVLIKYFPEYGIQYRELGGQMWIGVTLQKNGLGRLCLVATFYLIWTLVRRWQKRDMQIAKYQTPADVSVLALALFLLSGPGDQYSATALTSVGAGLLTFASASWMKRHGVAVGTNTLTFIMALVIGLGILQPFLGGATVTGVAAGLGRDLTMTGRTEIWAGLVPAAMQQPIFGSGFGSFWTPTTREMHEIGEAHNGYLEVLLDLGFVGLAIIAMFLLSSCRRAQSALRHNFDWGCLWLCFLLMTLIHNITESSINSFTSHLMSILLFLAISSTARVRKANTWTRKINLKPGRNAG